MREKNNIYSENGKVSLRQTYRMLFLEIFGISSLLLPAPLARICQNDGIFANLVAGVLWYLLLRVGICQIEKKQTQIRKENKHSQNPSVMKHARVRNTVPGIIQSLVFCAFGGFLLYVLTSLVENQLLDTEYLWIVVLTILFAGGYGIIRGIECRARIYEILFWILLIPLFLVLILAMFEMKPVYWLPVFSCGWGHFMIGVFFAMAAFSPVAVSFFFLPNCTRPEGVEKAATVALAGAVLLNAVLYMQLLGVFRWNFLSELRYPVISLMAVIQFPGEFFERQDALMTAIWFFCLFALFHSLCHYAVSGISRVFERKNIKKVRRKCTVGVLAAVFVIGMAFLLNGCGKKEPEESMYPLAIGVENVGNETQMIYYAWPQAGGDSGKTETPKGDIFEKTEADSLFRAQQIVSENTDKTLDFHHLKLLVLDVSVVQDRQQMRQLLEYFRENENMAWNTCVAVMDGEMEVLFSDEISLERPLGLYVEQMLNGREDLKRSAMVTVKDLMNLYENHMDTVLIPQLNVEDGKPVITGLRLCQRGMDRGIVQTKEQTGAYVLLEQAERMQLQLADGTDVIVQDIRVKRHVKEQAQNMMSEAETSGSDKERLNETERVGQQIVQNMVISGNLKLPESRNVTEERGRAICEETEQLLQAYLQWMIYEAQEHGQGDLTGSFGLLAGLDRTLWKQYGGQPEQYEEKLYTTIDVKLKQLRL